MRFTFDIPVALETRVIDAFSSSYGWQTEIDGNPNPETAQMFTRRKIKDYIAEVLNGYEVNKASETAIKQARDNKVDL